MAKIKIATDSTADIPRELRDELNIAVLPMKYAIILIIISVVLTLIAGFVPARMAAKKDPVTALRSE